MADLSTKQKILNASIRLFNENGIVNVRLQQIADEIGISVGNLAYHYRNKEAIISAVNEDLYQEACEILSFYRIYPNLVDFDNQLSKYFSFLQQYPFYFLDLLEIKRNYPKIHAKRKALIAKMVRQIRKRFEFNEQRELIVTEPRKGLYDSVSNAIWVLITFWAPQYLEESKNFFASEKRFKIEIWHQMYPYFNQKGIAEFEQLIQPLLELPSER